MESNEARQQVKRPGSQLRGVERALDQSPSSGACVHTLDDRDFHRSEDIMQEVAATAAEKLDQYDRR